MNKKLKSFLSKVLDFFLALVYFFIAFIICNVCNNALISILIFPLIAIIKGKPKKYIYSFFNKSFEPTNPYSKSFIDGFLFLYSLIYFIWTYIFNKAAIHDFFISLVVVPMIYTCGLNVFNDIIEKFNKKD